MIGQTGIKVLLIEPDAEDAELVRSVLLDVEDAVYRLDWEADVAQGIAAWSRHAHDVCLLDWSAADPEAGCDLLEAIRSHAVLTPVIVLTRGLARRADMAAMQAGASDYLAKGQLDSLGLERALRYAVERHRLLIELSSRHEQLRILAIRDPLTGTLNRRTFLEQLSGQVSAASRHQHPLTLALAEVQQLRSINERYGHAAADEVLRTVGHVVAEGLRTEDVVGRYDGSKLAMALPYTTSAQAEMALARLRAKLAQREFRALDHQTFTARIVVGLAELGPGWSVEQLTTAAERALDGDPRCG